MSDPCLNCKLPECNEEDPGCEWRFGTLERNIPGHRTASAERLYQQRLAVANATTPKQQRMAFTKLLLLERRQREAANA